jgi:hypothetical protein
VDAGRDAAKLALKEWTDPLLTLIEKRGLVIGNLGWVDGSSIWTFDLASEQVHCIPTGPAKYVALRQYGDILRIIYHESISPTIALRRLSELTTDGARLELTVDSCDFSGDAGLWESVDPCALVRAGRETWLIHTDVANRRINRLSLDWYWNGDYDLMYQGLTDCLTLPDCAHVIVSVQRSSRLVVLSLNENKKIGEVELAGRGGNPNLQLYGGSHVVTVDYDTVCLVDLQAMHTVDTVRLQDEPKGLKSFVGDARIDRDGLVIARPFSGDVLLLDGSDFATIGRATTGYEPLEAVQVSGSDIVARDWKTGALLRGSFRPTK